MLLLADGLFRLDLAVDGDTLRTMVRNLSTGALEMGGREDGDEGLHIVIGEAGAYEPSRSAIEFTLGSGGDRVEVKVLIATLRFLERGTVRVTAQAIIRPAPVS